MFLSTNQVHGNIVDILRSHEKHIDPRQRTGGTQGPEQSFGDVLINAFNKVNDQQVLSQDLAQQMVTDPDTVNVHDVTIAIAEANMALSMTKAVMDGVIQAYREIINTR